jgi:hypothetical protein
MSLCGDREGAQGGYCRLCGKTLGRYLRQLSLSEVVGTPSGVLHTIAPATRAPIPDRET